MKNITILLFLTVGLCCNSQNIKKAEKLFKSNSLLKAAETYNEILDRDNSISYKVLSKAATANYEIGNYRKAVSIYSRILDRNYSLEDRQLFNYVRSLRAIKEYERANDLYEEYLNNRNAKSLLAQFQKEKRSFDSISNLEHQNKFELNNLDINTSYAEFSPVVYQGDLIFSSSRPGASKSLYQRTEQPFLSLYKTKIQGPKHSNEVSLFSNKLNSNLHDATIAFSPNSDVIYYSSNEKSKSNSEVSENNFELYKARWFNNEVIDQQLLQFVAGNYSVGHPSVSPDGKVLFFASDMPGGYGGADIYFCKIYEDGSLSKPTNAGALINTFGNDFTPFLAKDGTFYFASDGHIGYGALDIYQVTFDAKKEAFLDLLNMGPEINTNYDDFSFYKDQTKGYLASNRPGGKGDDDIYSFTITEEQCTQNLQGIVYDAQNKNVLKKAIIYINDANGNSVKTISTNENGRYSTSVACNTDFKVTATVMDYLVKSKHLDKGESLGNVDFYLERPDQMIATNQNGEKQIKLDPIYFEYDKAIIRESSKATLDKVVDFLNFYPNIKIRIESHTDSRGSELYNLKLSKQRASATLKYILSRGIDKRQVISADGYGEYRPIIQCKNDKNCNESDYQINRRSSFIIQEGI